MWHSAVYNWVATQGESSPHKIPRLASSSSWLWLYRWDPSPSDSDGCQIKTTKKINAQYPTQLITSHLSIQQKLGLFGNFSRFNQLFHYKMQHKWRYVQEFKWKDGNRTNDDSKDVQLNLTMQEAVSPGAKSKGEVTNSPLSCWQRPLQTKKNHKTENWLLSENWKFNVNNALYCVNQQNHKTWFLQQQKKAKAQNLEKEETLPWWGQRVNWHWR